ncbi:MAG: asparagine synthase-related protein, partial [Planctomycetota bacterium]
GLHDKVALRAFARRRLPADIALRPKRPYRAPTTPALFAGLDGYVAELLAPAALQSSGLVDSPAAQTLVAKARARHGRMGGEREEMALVGLVTLQLLARQMTVELPGRVAAAVAALDRVPPGVSVDLTARCRAGRAPAVRPASSALPRSA